MILTCSLSLLSSAPTVLWTPTQQGRVLIPFNLPLDLGEGTFLAPCGRWFGFQVIIPPRICPGQHLADASLFLSIAMTLATFSISKAHDALSGDIVEPAVEWLPGVIR